MKIKVFGEVPDRYVTSFTNWHSGKALSTDTHEAHLTEVSEISECRHKEDLVELVFRNPGIVKTFGRSAYYFKCRCGKRVNPVFEE